MVRLSTERLLLRPFEQRDLEDLFEYARQPEVGPAAGWRPHEDIEETREVLQNFLGNSEELAIVDRAEDKVIGSIGLTKDERRDNNRAKAMGYALNRRYWGRGYMVEAVGAVLNYGFNTLLLNLVSIYHFPFNEQSRRVIEKCGFVYEGTLRQAKGIYDGRVHDVVCYSMTREEYRNYCK